MLLVFLLHTLLLALTFQFSTALYPTRPLYQFSNGTFVENIAVRSDGSLLVTIATSPDLYLVGSTPQTANPHLVHHFEGSTSVTGITEVANNVFVVAVSSVQGPGQPVAGSSQLWRIEYIKGFPVPKIDLVAKLGDVLAPNGLVTLSKTKVLLADSAQGKIFVVDLDTGVASVAIQDPLLLPSAQLPVGVNGLKIFGRALYFTNSGQNLLGRVEIDTATGASKGAAFKIVNGLPPAIGYDDFALSADGTEAYVSNAAGNFIEKITLRPLQQEIIAGKFESTQIAEPTSVAFGRNGKEDFIFVTTGGGLFFPVNGHEIVGGQLVAIQLPKKSVALGGSWDL